MKPRYVLVTTEYRGVFFGELTEQDGTTVTLKNARCAIYWNTTGGFIELADKGPNSGSRIGSVAPRLSLYQVTAVSDVTETAVKAWHEHN